MRVFLSGVLCFLLTCSCLAKADPVSELAPFLDSISDTELTRQINQLSSPDAQDAQGYTLLHHAACSAPDRVVFLLNQGVTPAIVDNKGNTPLHHLLSCGHAPNDPRLKETAEALIIQPDVVGTLNLENQSALHLALAQMKGKDIIDGYRDTARLLIAHGANLSLPNADGLLPIHLAVNDTSGSIIELLLGAGLDINAKDSLGRSPLWHAAGQSHNLSLVELLLQQGAQLQIEDQQGTSIIEHATANHQYDKLNLFLQLQPNASLPADDVTITLANALWNGAPLPLAQRLVAAGAQAANLVDLFEQDLAWRLAELDHTAELDFLIAQGLPINQLPKTGFPPLYFASTQATKILLELGADPDLLPNRAAGTTAAAISPVSEDYPEAHDYYNQNKTALLLQHGYTVNLKDNDGKAALEIAIQHNQLATVKHLLKAGADPLLNSLGESSLLPAAIETDRLPMITAIANSLPDLQQIHPDLMTNLVGRDNAPVSVVELFLIRGLPANQQDAKGQSLLHLAALNKNWELLPVLIKHGADIEATNPNGCTLRCYQWEIPEAVKQKIAQLGHDTSTPDSQFSSPSINDNPFTFFIIAAIPLFLVFLIMLAIQLAQHKENARITLSLFVALITGTLISSTLFYQCSSCITPQLHQLLLTSGIFLLVYLPMVLLKRKQVAEKKISIKDL